MPRGNQKSHRQKVTTLLMVFVLTVSVIGAGAGLAAAENTTEEDDIETADEVHVNEDGEIVLVYDEETDESISQAQFGADVTSGLAHTLIVFEDNETEHDITGDISTVVEPDSITGDAQLTVEDPEDVDDFNMSADFIQTEDESSFDGSIYAVTPADDRQINEQTAKTDGMVKVASDELQLEASLSDDSPAMFESPDQEMHVTIEGTSDGYTIEMSENRPIGDFNADQWNTEEAALNTLMHQYEDLAGELDGSADVTVTSYDYEEGIEHDRLMIDYTISVTGVQDAVVEDMVTEIDNDPSTNLTDEELSALEDGLKDVHIEEISFSSIEDGDLNEMEVVVHLENYEGPALSFMEAFAQQDSELVTENDTESVEETLDARAAADLTQTVTWEASEVKTNDETEFSVDVQYDSENWAAYTDELEERDIRDQGHTEVSVTVETEYDEVVVEGEYQVEREDLVDKAVDYMIATVQKDSIEDEDTEQLLKAIQDSEFEIAKTDISMSEDTVEIEAGAKFDDFTEFSNATDELYADVPMNHMYSETDENTSTTKTYVYVDDGTTVEQLEDAGVVTDETAVHEDSDTSAFPTMDNEAVANYLGVDLDDGSSISERVPGFGVVVALIAVLAAALIAARHSKQ